MQGWIGCYSTNWVFTLLTIPLTGSQKHVQHLGPHGKPELVQSSPNQDLGVFDVSRTTKILRRPGPKRHSMLRGRRRFYVTSRRIFVVREYFFERTMLGNETVVTHISKPAQFETGEPDLGEPVAQEIVLGLLIQWSRDRFPGKSVGGQYRPLHLRPGRPWNRVRVPLVVGHW